MTFWIDKLTKFLLRRFQLPERHLKDKMAQLSEIFAAPTRLPNSWGMSILNMRLAMIFRKFKKGLKWCQLASFLTVMKWGEKPLIFKNREWFLCSYYWLTYGLRNILHLKIYHHISSLLSIWSKLEFSWSWIKANILPTKCPLSSIIGDFQRIG